MHHFGNDRADGRGRSGGGALCDVEEMSEADPKEDISDLCGRMDAYDQYISDKQVKYSENTEVNRYRFKGKRIVPVVGIPEHTMVLGEFSTGMDSNLWMGVDYANDTDILKIDRLQANSELFFFQMRMKMDVNIVRPAEIVVHTAYKKSE